METLVWVLLYVALVFFMMRYGCCGMSHGSHSHHGSEGKHS